MENNNLSDEQEKKKITRSKVVKETKSIGLIILLVLVFRSVCFEPFKIPSGSMIPTLMIGDFILVNKMSYGLKVPFTHWFGDPVYITEAKNPERGDIIVFKYPQEPSVFYIKRVIGTPGDTIEVKNKVVYVNGEPLVHEEIDGKEIMSDMDDKFKGMNLRFFKEKIGKHEHVYQIDDDNYYKTDFEKTTVRPGHFFVMGDNRDFSYDSRFWGFVPHRHIKGKAILVWFSMIFPWNDEAFRFRFHRIFTLLD